MKQTFLIWMAIAILLSVVSCTSGGPQTVVTTEKVTVTEEVSVLPPVYLNGKDINIYTREDTFDSQWNVEYTGDAVDNAVFNRNKLIEEKMGVFLNYWCNNFGDTAWGTKMMFKNAVMEGEGNIDIIEGLNHGMASWVPDGLFTDLLNTQKVVYLDFSKEYWPVSLREQLTVDDSMYIMTGEADLGVIKNTICFYFNKEIVQNFKIEDPYDLVKSEEWTLEKMLELSQSVYTDRGEDGVDDNDLFGFMIENENQVNTFLTASGVAITVKDEKNNLQFNLGSTEALDLIDKLNVITSDLSCRPIRLAGGKTGTAESLLYVFSSGHSLFSTGYFSYAAQLTADEVSFGVLPYPTDNEGSDYHTTSNSYSMYAIASASPNIAEASAVLEALGYYGYTLTSPAYFERGLQKRYSETDLDAQMFDIIRRGLSFDLGDLLGPFTPNDLNGITPELRREIAYAKGMWTSTWEKNRDTVNLYLSDYFDGVRALKIRAD